MEGSERPRRALGPLPDDFGDPVVDSSAPAGPLIDDADLTDTGMMRRLALNPDGTLKDLIPPPRPVLPTSEAALPASAGRRFSADDSYDAEWAAPRRSAASVASPPSQYEPLLPPVSRPTQPPPVTVAYQPSASRAIEPEPFSMAAPELGSHALTPAPADAETPQTDDETTAKEAAGEAKADAKRAKAEAKADARAAQADAKAEAKAAKLAKAEAKKSAKDSPSQPSIAARLGAPEGAASTTEATATKADKPSRSIRPAFLVIAGVVVVLLMVTVAVVYVFRPASSSGANAPGAVDPILTEAEVAVLGAGPWTSAPTTQSAICLSGGTTVKADRSVSKLLSNTTKSSVLQSVDSYPDTAGATEAYNQRLTQLGTCADGTATVQSASTVKGLGESAAAVTLQARKGDAIHTVLLVHTDRTVDIFDVSTPEAIPLTALTNTATASLNRQCTGSGCPTSVSVEASLPAPGDPAGFLVAADLPLPHPGVGRWDTVDLPTVKVRGSGCEGVSLTKVPTATAAAQRTLILADDPAAGSEVFGLDQVSYTFPTAKAAQAFATTLSKNLSSCDGKLTATVDHTEKVSGIGAKSVPVTGQTWTVSHRIDGSTLTWRVAVVTSGARVTYLAANVLKDVDVSDAEWTAIALRAGQRASQA